MACDTRLRAKQTKQERGEEIRRAIAALASGLATGRIKASVGQQGAIAFAGWLEGQRDGVSDACAYRYIMATGSALAKQAIAKAELLAGRSVNNRALAQGIHSHDGGRTWDRH
jgi:hypothetical protein